VRRDLVAEHFDTQLTVAQHYEPPRYFLLFRQSGHRRSYGPFDGR
jgi:hypothetical protein